MSNIHPSAIVENGAQLHPSVCVGPYSIIGAHVTIGEGSTVGSHCVIEGHTTIGCNNTIHNYAALGAAPAAAQMSLPGLSSQSSDEPVTFTAESVSYDQNSGVVTATGRVEAWQGMRVLRADNFTYNRNTGVATAEGNVVLIEPDGPVWLPAAFDAF